MDNSQNVAFGEYIYGFYDSITMIDIDSSNNAILENSESSTYTGLTVFSSLQEFDTLIYSLTDHSSKDFSINPKTGAVTLAEDTNVNFETAEFHEISVKATGSNGAAHEQKFKINIIDEFELGIDDAYEVVELSILENVVTYGLKLLPEYNEESNLVSMDAKITFSPAEINFIDNTLISNAFSAPGLVMDETKVELGVINASGATLNSVDNFNDVLIEFKVKILDNKNPITISVSEAILGYSDGSEIRIPDTTEQFTYLNHENQIT